MAFRSRREKLRSILSGDNCVHPGSVYDAISIRIAEDLGFPLGMFGGSVASLAVLGDPDVTLITLTELAEQMRRMSRASALPVLVDADHGYGNALNVRRTIMEFERAGVAAIMIEDQVSPKRCGMLEGKRVVSPQEMEGKVKAAVDARTDDDFVICARTDARAVEGLASAIKRGQLYQRAGADVIFVEGPKTIEEAEAIAREIDIPLLYNITPTGSVPALDVATLERIGFRLLSCSVYMMLAALPSMQNFLRVLKTTGDVAKAGAGAAKMSEYLDILRLDDWQEREARFSPSSGEH